MSKLTDKAKGLATVLEAVQLKESTGAAVVAISMGPQIGRAHV